MKCKKTQAYFMLNGKRAEMVWTDWETEDNLCYDEIMHYYRQYAKIHKVELEWVKYGKKYVFKKPQGEKGSVGRLRDVVTAKSNPILEPRNPGSLARCDMCFRMMPNCKVVQFMAWRKERTKGIRNTCLDCRKAYGSGAVYRLVMEKKKK